MTYRDPGGRPRRHRLWPKDGTDLALGGWGLLGLLLTLLYVVGLDGSEVGAPGLVLGPLLVLHGSSPVFFFFATALYLTRQGRAIGADRRWVWTGFALTVPLWFLVGQPVAVRGAGDITLVLVPVNLLAFGLMWVGAWRTLRVPRGAASSPR